MFTSHTQRPRNVNTFQAAAILYGDWGTSKAYVIGLAFALAGYSSFWLIAMVCLLNALVGINYMTICRLYPSGGGVYASVRNKSEILALVGAFFLIADYLVTAALSALSAFNYLGVANPGHWAILAVVLIGILNFLGPRHTGNLAILVSLPVLLIVLILGLFSIPHLSSAIQNLQPLPPSVRVNWNHFVGVIVALSGIEAIANTTGVMRLDPGKDERHPSVYRTSTPAILWVMMEVCFFTALFGLAIMALPDLQVVNGEVIAPEQGNIRDSMLRYMGEKFAFSIFGANFSHLFGILIAIVFLVLLLSAVNTAMVALTSLLFVMSRDGELPSPFQKLNLFGVPYVPLIFATLVPALLIYVLDDVKELANLYAVGFVGAIATNLGFTGFDWDQKLSIKERTLMIVTFLIMAAIEITLLIDKPNARNFAISIMSIGLLLRGWVLETQQRKWRTRKAPLKSHLAAEEKTVSLHPGSMLCAVAQIGKTLEYAIVESNKNHLPLLLLFIRNQQVITEEDRHRYWLEDEDACEIFDYAKEHLEGGKIKFVYIVSDSPANTILETANKYHISKIVLGMPRGNKFFQFIRGNIVSDLGKILPEEIDLLVIS